MDVNALNNITQKEVGGSYVRGKVNAYRVAGGDFRSLVSKEVGELKFSAHAQARIKSRNIPMTQEIMSKLDKAVSGAKNKGARDTLVLLSDLAFIVNVPKNTVVTALEGKSIRENIFTNIDSTVIAD